MKRDGFGIAMAVALLLVWAGATGRLGPVEALAASAAGVSAWLLVSRIRRA